MKRMTIIRVLSAGMFCCLAALSSSCSEDGGFTPSGNRDTGQTFVLEYILPNTGQKTRSTTYDAYVPSANDNENRVDELHLLFFDQNDHGNGNFINMIKSSLSGGSIGKIGSVQVDITGMGVSNDKDYNVLVLANAHKYFTDESELTKFCIGKTENMVRLLLQAQMPTIPPSQYEIPGDLFLMSGSAVKSAGKDMQVDLLRAAVRVDVKVADDKTNEYELLEAIIRNACPRIPLFGLPADLTFTPLQLNKNVSADGEKKTIRGGLYLPETLRTGLDNLTLRKKQCACVLVRCKKKTETDDTRCWYRVDLALGDDGVQYLRRNNAYIVVVKNIKGPGYPTPDDAYESTEKLLEVASVVLEDWLPGDDYEQDLDFGTSK